jgi:hypothetical protein
MNGLTPRQGYPVVRLARSRPSLPIRIDRCEDKKGRICSCPRNDRSGPVALVGGIGIAASYTDRSSTARFGCLY